MTGYARKFEENATMSFIVKDKQLLKNYTNLWEKIEKLMKINFESNPVCGDDDKYIKKKIKTHAGNIITKFSLKKKNAKRKSPMQMFINNNDSVIKANKKYYPQTLFEECKYIQVENYINKDLENSESDSDSIMRQNLILNNLLFLTVWLNIVNHYNQQIISLFILLVYIVIFFASRYFFGILLVFLRTYYGICFSHINFS